MKSNKIIIVSVILIGILFIWLFKRHNPTNNLKQFSSNNSLTNVVQPSLNGSQSQQVTTPQNTHQSQTTNSLNAKPPSMDELVEQEYSHPFLFYGKVVDQDNAAVQGATASFNWATPNANEEHSSSISDDQGLFSLEKGKGYKLQITVSKAGYYTPRSESLTTIAYGDELGHETFEANPASPVIFHLRKKGSGVGLIHNLQLFGFRTNGPVQFLDLLQGKNRLTPPGDLAVQFNRGEKNAAGKYDWSVVISVPNGGLYETNEEFMFVAPKEGYQPAIEIHYDADDSDWLSQSKMKFYFTSRNGSIYGWAEATIIPRYQDGAAIDLNYYINPSGSQNLEPAQ